MENTNYFLTTTTGEYVLTLFEKIPRADLPFYIGLMHHLAHHGVTCPDPMPMDQGESIAELNGKPACIVTRLPGMPRLHPTAADCRAVGRILATLHLAGLGYEASLANWCGRAWRERFAECLRPELSREGHALIAGQNRFELTLAQVQRFGLQIEHSNWQQFTIPAQQSYHSPGHITVEGDASSASYFLAAGAIGHGPVRVQGVGRNSVQGDVRFAAALEMMGAKISMGENWIETSGQMLTALENFCMASI